MSRIKVLSMSEHNYKLSIRMGGSIPLGSSLRVVLESPSKSKIVITDDSVVSIGEVDAMDAKGVVLAGSYIDLLVRKGLFYEAGAWVIKGVVEGQDGKVTIGPKIKFIVRG